MRIKRFLSLALILVGTSEALAIRGAEDFEKKLFENHRELQALEKEMTSQESLIRASQSGYYPTLNAVGGWAKDKSLASGDYQGAVGYFEGKWNLFRGLRDSSVVEIARTDADLKKIEFELKKRSLQVELTQVLGQMIYTHHLLSLLDEEGKLTQTQRQMAAKKVSAGLTGQVDNIEFDLRDSEIEIQKRNLNQDHLESHQKLNALLGAEISDQEIEKLDFEEKFQGFNIDIQKTLKYRQAEAQVQRASSEKNQARSDFLPSIDFEYRYGHLTPGQTDDVKFNESRVGLLLTIPLFSGLDTLSRTKSGNFNVQAKENSLIQTQRDIKAEISTLLAKQKTLSDLAEINSKRLESAKKYYDLTLGEYRRGVKNSPDVVTATERWFESQKQKYEIKKELEEIRIRLQSYL